LVLTGFGVGFWKDALRERGYTVVEERLDLETLAKQRVVPSSHLAKGRDSPCLMDAILLYRDRYVEAAALVYDRLPSRGVCVRVARQWRENRLYRPLLIFTDGESCYAVIVRGAGLDGEARVLHLEDRLYRTDMEVLESIKHPGNLDELRRKYDEEFFPYEKVRDEFFNRYRELYEKVVAATRRVIGEKRAKEYAQRFLGRLMFIYFLQRKGWLNNDKNYIDKIADYRALNDLFYNKLNKEDGDGIPYLNGSLFEREDYIEELETKAGHKLDEIFKEARRLFNNYNFTVDETSPLEVEVSVDPLLLGTVLENMLPEHERGAKGTFYTPVNEIGFICRKALAAWLGVEDRVGKDRLVDGLQEYIEGLKRRRDEREIREFREKLLSVKVCDPAVGSGGFLVVMMQTIIALIQEVEEAVGWRADPAIYKARILTNLYGFDIEPEAVEIARLRLWLSLIVDQKKPEPLPNLDMNIILTNDSLTLPEGGQSVIDQFLSGEFAMLVEQLNMLRSRYVTEHDNRKKTEIRKEIEDNFKKLLERAPGKARRGLPLEFIILSQPDIIVMNPPYIRQEKIDKQDKDHYVQTYFLDRTSDIYAYFMVRALKLLKGGGTAAIISSDKWLEVGYGLKLQERLKPHILAVYGQRMRSFTADVNTVITVLKKDKLPDDHPIQFIYLSKYGGDEVINHKSIPRGQLSPGKWYYLRAPKIFEEKLLPKLNHRLRDFADIKRGFTTGANEFFYMKDITHLYEADYLANPKKFEEWGVKAKTGKELLGQGLIYIENEGGERFVVDRKDVVPIIKSPKEITSYSIGRPKLLCLYTKNPGKFTYKYIEWGVKQGLHKKPTCKSRNPWFKLPDLEPAHLLFPMFVMARFFFGFSSDPVVCDNMLYTVYPKSNKTNFWLYINSTIFYLTAELYSLRMGGGALALKVNFYEDMPVPNLKELNVSFPAEKLLKRTPLPYYDEVKQLDRRELDKAVLRALGFPEHELDTLVDELHKAFVWVVEDRLIKAGRPLQGLEEEEYGEDN
jgi:hypothetical protein